MKEPRNFCETISQGCKSPLDFSCSCASDHSARRPRVFKPVGRDGSDFDLVKVKESPTSPALECSQVSFLQWSA